MEFLYSKYRPKKFSEVIGQDSIVKILERQLETDSIFNCMIFSGVSGTGKTTIARIFANELNNNIGFPIEIDAASNNSVDNVRQIVTSASERSVHCKYKVYILDEAHMLSTQAWNAFLKTLEEPPKYTIFIFCTTELHKIPETIQNRCMTFYFTRVDSSLIEHKLDFICRSENSLGEKITNWNESINYISRICEGEVRKAISMLETCLRYSDNLSIENVLLALGSLSYNNYCNIIDNILDGNINKVNVIINDLYNKGINLKRFVDLFLDFCLDILKYILTNDIQSTKFPLYLEDDIKKISNFEKSDKYYLYFIDKLLELKNMIKIDNNEKITIEVVFSQMCRFV